MYISWAAYSVGLTCHCQIILRRLFVRRFVSSTWQPTWAMSPGGRGSGESMFSTSLNSWPQTLGVNATWCSWCGWLWAEKTAAFPNNGNSPRLCIHRGYIPQRCRACRQYESHRSLISAGVCLHWFPSAPCLHRTKDKSEETAPWTLNNPKLAVLARRQDGIHWW